MEVTVKSSTKTKEVSGKPVYKVELTDGRFGESFARDIPVGTPAADIEITENQYGLKFKLKNKGGGGGFGGGRQRAGNESFALSYSKDVIVAMIPKMESLPSSADLGKVITSLADTFYNWLESKKS